MKRLILSSTNFSGDVIIVYDLENKLMLVDMSAAVLKDDQIAYLKKVVPVIYFEQTFIESFNTTSVRYIEEGFEVSFEMWFDAYGTKRNKQRCLALWDKLSKGDQAKAYFKLKEYLRHLTLNTWKTKLEPDSYLKGRHFDNDYSK